MRGKKRVVLIFPRMIGAKDQIRRAQPPLGICSIAAVLEQRGHEVMLVDSVLEGYEDLTPLENEPNLVEYGLSDDAVVSRTLQFDPDVIGISALFSSQASAVFSLSRALKKAHPGVPVVFGGIHASTNGKSVLSEEPSIDFVLAGESDHSFPDLVERLPGDCYGTPGLVWREGKRVRMNSKPPFIRDMDALPFPAWHLLDMEKYFEIGMPHNPFITSNRVGCIMTSRGCPERCYFCSSSEYFGHSYRAMSAGRVVGLVRHMVDRFGIRELQIEDDSFTLNATRVIEICKELKEFKIRITLPNAIRADAPVDTEKRLRMFQAMREAGVEQIGMSVEHGDQEFLNDVIGKRLDLNEVVRTCELAHRAGLLVHANFMVGFPFETASQREKTMKFAKELDADSYSVSLVTPLPGTRLWEIVRENDLFMEGFNLNRVLYVYVSIKPCDISPEKLYEQVCDFNRELNEAGQRRRPETARKYSLFKGKKACGDRKYHFLEE
ncbi:cobalamin-dependent protein [bacterium]|nr:cobalamin-dependent protein [bacterium]